MVQPANKRFVMESTLDTLTELRLKDTASKTRIQVEVFLDSKADDAETTTALNKKQNTLTVYDHEPTTLELTGKPVPFLFVVVLP